MLNLLWLIPILPLAGAAVNGLLGRRFPKALVTLVGVGFPLASLLLALGCLWEYSQGSFPGETFRQVLYPWTAGQLAIDVAFQLDRLSAVMLFVVTFVGFLIHVYSAGYMAHEEGYRRYFSYLNLFMCAMLLLVLGANYLIMFVGWEGVGLCSYLLIGFYYDQPFPPYAGKKAFIVNRIGDFAFLVGLFALIANFGSLDYSVLGRIAENPSLVTGEYWAGLSLASFIALCFFVGAMGKSAQIPLYVWLPDAMAGPTPVSALIHAATMVTAGVYMVFRSNVIYRLAPDVSLFVAIIGAATAIFAATIAFRQTDIKKVLAYSTVSQLGYMFLAAGLGAYTAALFHVMTHAFFKALLFLGSGSVIHAMGGEQDMRQMGGLKKHLPQTYWTYVIGSLAIAGIFPFAGFFSKDEILHAAAGHGQWILYTIGLITAGLTAFYMFRSVYLTFHGKFRGTHEQEHHLHESPPSMTIPLWILAIGSIVSGWVGVPWNNLFHHFLEPVIPPIAGAAEAPEHHVSVLLLAIVALVVAAAGIFLALRIYGGDRGLAGDQSFARRFPALQRLLENKYYVDEIYDRLVVKPLAWLSRMFWKVVDTFLIDGAVNAGAFLTELTGDVARFSTTGNVRNYALYFFAGVILLFWWIVS
jgi:NADH-quinone oxidoreductase subunit L